VRRGLDTDDILSRFRAERQILAQLDHPNIARLIDAGSTEDGLPYFVMEHVAGEPISSFCDARKLDTEERLELFRSVCSAVTYAHQHLVVHRDIKPSNILVTGDGVPKLLDFGIAKVLHTDGGQEAQTLTGTRVMTPEYASPEQVRGGTITTSSDIYSLGVLLYELLTGQKPYRLTTHTHDEISRAIVEQVPERPSGVAGGSSADRKALRGDLDKIVLMALRKEPERRYASVAQFSADIERHLAGRPVLAHKDTVSYRAAKFIKRNKIAVGAALLVLLTLITGVIATAWQAKHATSQARIAAGRAGSRAQASDQGRPSQCLPAEHPRLL
jgi:serine/threonine protein kinase